MDEFFEVVDMMELKKMRKVPVVLVGKEYWKPLFDFLRESPLKFGCFSGNDLEKWQVVDSAPEAIEIIRKAKTEKEDRGDPVQHFQLDKKLGTRIVLSDKVRL